MLVFFIWLVTLFLKLYCFLSADLIILAVNNEQDMRGMGSLINYLLVSPTSPQT